MPFQGLVASVNSAEEIVSPPYDVISRLEAKARVVHRPSSFLRVSRAEIEFPETIKFNDDVVYARAAKNFANLINSGALKEDSTPAFYIWQLQRDNHTQTGVITAASVLAYESGLIMRHEHTRPEKEEDRVRHLNALSAATGPTLLTHRPDPRISELVDELKYYRSIIDVRDLDGVHHIIWRVSDPNKLSELGEALNQIPRSYIADGHHRTAASSRLVKEQGIIDGRFLGALFPSDQLLVLDYNRVVRDLNGLSVEEFMQGLDKSFELSVMKNPEKPCERGSFTLYIQDCWYSMKSRITFESNSYLPKHLDVALLNSKVLEPLLNIYDLRTDPRVDFIGGVRGLQGLKKFIEDNNWAAGFALYPTSINALMSVADSGSIMPPKSTWFEPKLADGLVSLPIKIIE